MQGQPASSPGRDIAASDLFGRMSGYLATLSDLSSSLQDALSEIETKAGLGGQEDVIIALQSLDLLQQSLGDLSRVAQVVAQENPRMSLDAERIEAVCILVSISDLLLGSAARISSGAPIRQSIDSGEFDQF